MRIKRGVTKRQKKKKILKLAKGYRMSYSKNYRRAKEAVLHAGQYSYAHRRHRRSDIRTEWIKIISSSLIGTDLSYSEFIKKLKENKIELDRKILAELALYNKSSFQELLKKIN